MDICMVPCYLVKPWRRAWGGDKRTAPAAVLPSCISNLGLVGQTIWLLRSGLERQGRAKGGDGKQGTRWGTPAARDGLRWLGSVRRWPTLSATPNKERAGGAQGAGGVGRGHEPKYWPLFAPSSYLFGANYSL
jgi:hypothetical protein